MPKIEPKSKKAKTPAAGALEAIALLQDSVELARSAKGDISWKVKLYFDRADGHVKVLKQMEEIQAELRRTYLI